MKQFQQAIDQRRKIAGNSMQTYPKTICVLKGTRRDLGNKDLSDLGRKHLDAYLEYMNDRFDLPKQQDFVVLNQLIYMKSGHSGRGT